MKEEFVIRLRPALALAWMGSSARRKEIANTAEKGLNTERTANTADQS